MSQCATWPARKRKNPWFCRLVNASHRTSLHHLNLCTNQIICGCLITVQCYWYKWLTCITVIDTRWFYTQYYDKLNVHCTTSSFKVVSFYYALPRFRMKFQNNLYMWGYYGTANMLDTRASNVFRTSAPLLLIKSRLCPLASCPPFISLTLNIVCEKHLLRPTSVTVTWVQKCWFTSRRSYKFIHQPFICEELSISK